MTLALLLASTVAEFLTGAGLVLATNPLTWGILISLVYLFFIRKNAALDSKVRQAALMAFHIVEDLDAQGLLPPSVKKAEVALKHFTEILQNQDVKVTDELLSLAKLIWSALHGEQAFKVDTTAKLAAAGAASPQ